MGTNAKWLGAHLDWYGIDIYDGPKLQQANGLLHRTAIIGRMDQNLQHWRAAAGKRALSVRITETNSAHDNHRENWMLWLSEWMAANNGYRIVTFWGGKLSAKWPPSQTVLDYYRFLQRQLRSLTRAEQPLIQDALCWRTVRKSQARVAPESA